MADPVCPPEKHAVAACDQELRNVVIEQFSGLDTRITPLDLERRVASKYLSVRRADIRSSIRKMIADGRLGYCCHNAVTCLELDRNAVLRIGRRLALGPPGCRHAAADGRVFISLATSASFGTGTHPTTQLCLKGLELALTYYETQMGRTAATAVDIGTGTGVLAIAAALLGVKTVTATDIDPLARFEACRNVAENGLTPERVTVLDTPPHALRSNNFDVLLANLRPPTLKRLFGEMVRITRPGGIWVVSGFRPSELEWMKNSDVGRNNPIVWHEQLKNWGAMAIQWV